MQHFARTVLGERPTPPVRLSNLTSYQQVLGLSIIGTETTVKAPTPVIGPAR